MGSTPPEDDPDGPDSNGSDGDADAPEQGPTGSNESTDREPGAESGGAHDASDGDAGDDEDPFEWGAAEDAESGGAAGADDDVAPASTDDAAGATTGEATSLSDVERQTAAGGGDGDGDGDDRPVYGGWADWLAGIVIALGGLVVTLIGGAVLAARSDILDEIETAIEEENPDLQDVSQEELIDLADAAMTWFGAGTVLVGLLVLGAGVLYVLERRKARRGTSSRISETLAHGVVGAVAGLLLSFIPLSEVVGGAVAGYLEEGIDGSPLRAGALAGAIAVLPIALLGIVLAVTVAIGFATIGDPGVGIVSLVGILVGVLFALGISAALSALGGWIGGKVASDG